MRQKNCDQVIREKTTSVASKVLLAAGIVAVLALQGCALKRINDNLQDGEGVFNNAMQQLGDRRAERDLNSSRPSMQRMDKLWVDKTPIPLNAKELAGKTSALDCKITFNPKTPVSLSEFTRVATNLCGISIQITQDATMFMNGTLMRTGGAASAAPAGGGMAAGGTIGGAPLPPPTLSGPSSLNTNGSIGTSNSVFTSATGDSISGITWENKPLRGLLDLVAARLGLGWKFEDNVATFYYIDTQVFQLYAIPGTTIMKTAVKSGTESGGGGGQSAGGFKADGSSQNTELQFQTDILKDIEKTLQTMITANLGRISISASTGTVTATDRPDVLRRVKAYLESENKRLTRQVLLKVKVLSVSLSDSDSAGLNWDMAYKSVTQQLGLASAISPVTGAASASMGIIGGTSEFDGSKVLINALSKQGRVYTVASPSVTTLNMKPAPILVGTQTTYLASVATTAVAGNTGGSSQQALTPGTLTTGFNMTLLPYLMDGPEMLLQYSVNLSSLINMKTISSGGNQIQMPEVDNRIFSQSVRLRSGETLILSGFDQQAQDAKSQGVGDSKFWLLGGEGATTQNRTVVVVLITPIVTN